MKDHVSSICLALLLLIGLCPVPALAGEAPAAYRLAGAELTQDGETAVRYTFDYPEGGALPGEEKMEYLAGDGDDYVYTYTYDEAGRLIQSYGYAAGTLGQDGGPEFSFYVYGDDGELVPDKTADNTTGDVFMSRFTYDEQGRLTEESSSHTMADGTMSAYDALYIYDDAGRIAQRLSGDNGELSYVTEYTYDGEGQLTGTSMCSALAVDYDDEGMPVVTEMSEPINETSYTYDEQGRPAGMEVRMDGKPATEIEYSYAEAPLFMLQYGDQQDYDEAGAALQEPVLTFRAVLQDSAGQDVLSFDLQGQAELTFDDAGYLTRAVSGSRTLEFTYEPAD